MRSCPNLHHIKRSPVALPNGAAPPLREHDKLPQIFHHITKYHHLTMVHPFTNDLWRRHRPNAQGRSEGRRAGTACVSTSRSRWSAAYGKNESVRADIIGRRLINKDAEDK